MPLSVRPTPADVLPSYGVGRDAAEHELAGRADDRPGVVFALSVNAVTATGFFSVRSVGAGELVERRCDLGAERDGQLDLARVDLEPAAARVLADAVDLERRRARAGGDELAAQAEAEDGALPRGEERLRSRASGA